VRDPDKKFVASVVEALGRCAQALPEIADKCMELLMKLVGSSDKDVVAQSVIVVRQLLQCNAKLHSGIIRKIALLLDDVEIPSARAAIVWIIGEYREKIPLLAPDCLRKLAKSFCDEEDFVKMQILNLSMKLFLSNPQQTAVLFRYVMDLCKYDLNFDLRDRTRLIKALFFKKKAKRKTKVVESGETGEVNAEEEKDEEENDINPIGTEVKDTFKQMLLSEKPAPVMVLPYKDRENFTIGSLSHTMMQTAHMYEALPDFPKVAPDPDVRNPKGAEEKRGSDSDSDAKKMSKEKKRQ